MTREMLIEELNKLGYEAYPWDVTKNSIQMQGIRIKSDHDADPIIYTEELIAKGEASGLSVLEVSANIIKIYERNKGFDFDIEQLSDRDFVLPRLFIGIQKVSQENLVKRPCEELDGLECYLFLRSRNEKGTYSIRLSPESLSLAAVTAEEAWAQALKNVEEATTVENLRKVISEMTGDAYSEGETESTPLYVISNKERSYGASSILNKKALTDFAGKFGVSRIIVLPSSIHEMLLIPCPAEADLEIYSDIVSDVNDLQVAPQERLTDRAYILDFEKQDRHYSCQNL